MSDYWKELLFQADCIVNRAYFAADEGAKLVAFDPDTQCMVFDDGDSIEELWIEPIEDLLKALKSGSLPPKPPGGY